VGTIRDLRFLVIDGLLIHSVFLSVRGLEDVNALEPVLKTEILGRAEFEGTNKDFSEGRKVPTFLQSSS